jgi:hypothetical protein
MSPGPRGRTSAAILGTALAVPALALVCAIRGGALRVPGNQCPARLDRMVWQSVHHCVQGSGVEAPSLAPDTPPAVLHVGSDSQPGEDMRRHANRRARPAQLCVTSRVKDIDARVHPSACCT